MRIEYVKVPKLLIYNKDRPLIPDQEVEVHILEQMKMNNYGPDSMIYNITQKILNNVYQTENKEYPFKEIETFYNFRNYINLLSDKMDTVNMFILNKTDNPFIVDYCFKEWENDLAIYEVKIAGDKNVSVKE